MHYKWKTGMFAWILHRASGIALAIYLPLHIYVTSSLQDPARFDKVMAFVSQPLFKLAEVALLGAVIYHSLNGVRILIIDWLGGTKVQARVFALLVIVGIVLFIAGAIPLVGHIIRPAGEESVVIANL